MNRGTRDKGRQGEWGNVINAIAAATANTITDYPVLLVPRPSSLFRDRFKPIPQFPKMLQYFRQRKKHLFGSFYGIVEYNN